jgi:hypothetical protein
MPGADAMLLQDRLAAAPADDAAAQGFSAVVLTRHGRRPWRGEARLLFGANGAAAGSPIRSEIELYELRHGGFVTAIRHAVMPAGHLVYADATPCDDAAAVRDCLLRHRPEALVPLTALADPQALAGGDMRAATAGMQRLQAAWQALLAPVFGGGLCAAAAP